MVFFNFLKIDLRDREEGKEGEWDGEGREDRKREGNIDLLLHPFMFIGCFMHMP